MSSGNLQSKAYDVSDTAEAIEFYFEKGWTDGLPVIPPTEASIRAMLNAVGLEPGQEITPVLDSCQLLRILLHRRCILGGLAAQLRQVAVRFVQHLSPLPDVRVDLLQCCQGPASDAERPNGIPGVSVEGVYHSLRVLNQRAGLAEAA